MQDFKHIRAWQRAHALSIALHKATRGFARAGHARTQLVSAAQSIGANIVEGCGAATNKEFARFLDMSVKSANETEHHLIDARDFELMPPVDWQKHTAETIEVRKMIYGYRKKVIQSSRGEE